MAMNQIINLDDILSTWASSRFGSDYVVEKVDTSKVQVSQGGTLYHSGQDWWGNTTVHEEVFDNNERLPATWHYAQKLKFHNTAAWTLVKVFKSGKLLPIKIHLEYPIGDDNGAPLGVDFDTGTVGQQVRKVSEKEVEWDVETYVTVQPFSSSHACAEVRTCKMKNVNFTTDILFSGTIKIIGHKKNKKGKKHEVAVSICDALEGKEVFGFQIRENVNDPTGPGRQVAFRVEGLCTGQVGVEATAKLNDIQTLV